MKKIRTEFATVPPICNDELSKFLGSAVEVGVSVGELVGVAIFVAVKDGVWEGTEVLVETGIFVDLIVGVGNDNVAVSEAISEGTTDESFE